MKKPAREFQAKKFQGGQEQAPHKFQWPVVSELLPPLPFLPQMQALYQAIAKVWPLNERHRKSLPRDIRDLSAILTCERGQLRTSYWNRPGFVSAYLYYFLPWNIIRLGRLLTGLPLPDPAVCNDRFPVLLDAGSGPLSLPLALWLARPAWRRLSIHVAALDAVKQPLQLGARIFAELGKILECPVWQVHTVNGPLWNLGKSLPQGGYPWLVTMANALNELNIRARSQVREEDEEEEAVEEAMAERYADLLEAWKPLLQTAPLLLVEPGTRLGGKIVMRFRETALDFGLEPLAPCPHVEPCPLQEHGRTWCHFVFSAQDAPDWLKALAREARLFKTSLTLAAVLLQKAEHERKNAGNSLQVRVVSQSFTAGGEISRYGCAACGLCLLPQSRQLVSGTLTMGHIPQKMSRDAKSGAAILEPGAMPGQEAAKIGKKHTFNKDFSGVKK